MDIFSEFSPQIYTLLVTVVILCIVFVLLGNYVNKQDPVQKPKKLMLLVEIYYNAMDKLVNSIFFGNAGILLPYCSMLIVYIWVMNMLSLVVPFDAPTTDYNVPLALVVISFVFRYGYDYKFNGIRRHFKSYFEPYPFMAILGVLDIIAKPLSMSMRLFGNILSGTLILAVFYSSLGALQEMIFHFAPRASDGTIAFNFLGAIVAPPFHFYFDVFAGTIQAFVFTLLTLIFTALELDFDLVSKKRKAKEDKKRAKLELRKKDNLVKNN